MKNMGWIKSPIAASDSFTIKSGLADGVYFTDQETQNIVATPSLQPGTMNFTSPEIQRTSDKVNDRINITVYLNFTTNAVSSDGTVILTFPDDVIYDDGETLDAYLVTNSSASATTAKTLHSSGAINTITLSSICSSSGCAAGSSLTVLIQWVRNPPAVTTVTSTVTGSSATSQGWVIDQATSSAVNTIFSALTAQTITNVNISPDDPAAGATTNYDVIFTADTDIPQGSQVVITLPSDVTISSTNSGGSTSLDTCANLFNTSVTLTCTVSTDSNGNTVITVDGLFPDATDNSGQFGIDLGLLVNPSTTGNTGAFQIDIVTSDGDAVASEDSSDTANNSVEIKTEIPDADCDSNCATCSGTSSSCDTCNNPSNTPFLQNNTCVDSCSSGYFLQDTECFQCHSSCASCSGYADNNCLSCASGFNFENGYCVSSCSKNTEVVDGSCQSNSTNGECNTSCATCTKDLNWCLTCDQSSSTPIVNPVDGTCVANSLGACDTGYYVDNSTNSCQI